MKTRIAVVVALWVLAIPALAQAQVVQHKRLTTSSKVQTWTSKSFSPEATIYAYVLHDGKEIEQVWISSCSAAYPAAGFLVRVEVVGCNGNDPYRYRLRYVGFGRHRFDVWLTDRVR